MELAVFAADISRRQSLKGPSSSPLRSSSLRFGGLRKRRLWFERGWPIELAEARVAQKSLRVDARRLNGSTSTHWAVPNNSAAQTGGLGPQPAQLFRLSRCASAVKSLSQSMMLLLMLLPAALLLSTSSSPSLLLLLSGSERRY